MSAFLSELIVGPWPTTARADGKNWVLVEDLTYDSSSCGLIVVPAGFLTDFASTPAALWSRIPPWGVYGPATVLHDFVYLMHGTGRRDMTREQADNLLLEAMDVLTVPEPLRSIIYDGVRIGGQSGWDEDGRRADAGERHITE